MVNLPAAEHQHPPAITNLYWLMTYTRVYVCVNKFLKFVTWKWKVWELNLWPVDYEYNVIAIAGVALWQCADTEWWGGGRDWNWRLWFRAADILL